MDEELLPRLLGIARDVLDEEELEFDPSTPFAEIEAWDSLNHIHMVVRMEQAFGIRFDLASLQGIGTVGDLLGTIARLMAA